MNLLIIGSSAAEHSMVKAFSQYENVENIYVAPGNHAINEYATCLDLNCDDFDELVDFAKSKDIHLTICSNEYAIANGIADRFLQEGMAILAPTSEAARITTNKSICKKFMYKTKIPTAKFGIFDRENMAVEYVRKSKFPLIVKTDTHQSGENVFICDSFKIAKRIIEDLFDTKNKKVIIEDFVQGREFSYYVITDGYNAMPICSVVPYKQVLEGNGGAITSGLGAYAPFYMIDAAIERKLFNEIVYPALDELGKNGNPYVGVLGIDLIIDRDGKFNVLEFNSFFKEPDIQCILQLLDVNMVDVMRAAVYGSLVDEYRGIDLKPGYSTSVVLTAGTYPGEGLYGETIIGVDEVDDIVDVAHFNTRKDVDGNWITAGGRTLAITSWGATLEKSAQSMYENVELVKFTGKRYRCDIGKTLLVGF